MLIPTKAETLTLYLNRDFALTYTVGLDLSVNGGCTVYSDIIDENGKRVASFTTTVTGVGNPSTFTRTLSKAAMRSAGLQPNLRYKTDMAVVGFSGVGLTDPLTTAGYLTVKDTATVTP